MPPPSLSTTTMRRSAPRAAQRRQRAGVVDEGDVADERRPSARPPQGDAERGRHDAVDAVGAPVGVGRGAAGRRTTPGRASASTRRRRRCDAAGQVAGDEAGDGRLAERRLRPEDAVDGRLGRRRRRRSSADASRRRRRRASAPAERRPSAAASRRATTMWSGSIDARPTDLHDGRAGRRRPTGRAPSTTPDGRGARRPRAARRRTPSWRSSGVERRRRRRRRRGSRDVGSASSGHPVAATNADDVAAGGAPPPASTTPAAATRAASTSVVGHVRRRRRQRGRGARRRGGSAPGVADERLAERQVEVHRAVDARRRRPARRATATPAPSPSSATPGSWNQRDGPAVQVGLVDRLRRPDVAQLRRPVGGERRASARPDSPASTTAGWKLAAAVPLVHSSTAGVPAEPEAEGDEAGDALVVDDVHRELGPGGQGERPSACCATRGRRRRGATPAATTSSSTSVGAERRLAVGLAVTAGMRRRSTGAPVPPSSPGRVRGRTWPCSSRSGPTSSARGATSASAASPRRSAELAADPTFDARRSTSSTARSSSTRRRRRAPPMPVADAYARKFGGPRAGRGDHRQRHRRSPPSEGLEFHLDRAQRANTRDAHRLLWYAEHHGAPGTQADLKERLLSAYFTDGLHVGDPDVLVDERRRRRPRRATTCAGSSTRRRRPRRGRAEPLAFAAEAGITAVPTYVIDGRWSIPGAQDPDVFVQVLAPPRRHRTCRLSGCTLAATVAAAGPRLVLVHGFTQTGRSWDAARRAPRRPTTRSSPSTRPATAARRDVARRPRRRRRAARRDRRRGRRTSATRWAAGCACTSPLARPDLVERLVLVSATAGIDDAGERAARRGGRRGAGDVASSATASTRSSTAGSPSRCSPRSPTPASTTAAATPSPGWRRACASPAPAPRSRCGTACRR